MYICNKCLQNSSWFCHMWRNREIYPLAIKALTNSVKYMYRIQHMAKQSLYHETTFVKNKDSWLTNIQSLLGKGGIMQSKYSFAKIVQVVRFDSIYIWFWATMLAGGYFTICFIPQNMKSTKPWPYKTWKKHGLTYLSCITDRQQTIDQVLLISESIRDIYNLKLITLCNTKLKLLLN